MASPYGASVTRSRPRLLARVAFACLTALFSVALASGAALADGGSEVQSGEPLPIEELVEGDASAWRPGGVVLTDCSFTTWGENAAGELHPQSVGLPYAVLQFSKNVSYAAEGEDPGFVEENASKVHLRKAGSDENLEASVETYGNFESRMCLGVRVDGWLDPLTDYEVVVEPGIVAANGIDVSDREYVIPFRTSEECADGLSVYEKAGIVLLTAAVVAGVAAGVVRMRREKRL